MSHQAIVKLNSFQFSVKRRSTFSSHMFLLCSLVSSQASFFSTIRNMTISISNQESQKLLNNEPSWFYVYSDKEISRSSWSIDYKPSNVINKHWMSIFLNSSQANELSQAGFALRPLANKEKLIPSDLSNEQTEVLFIEASDTFIEPKTEGLEFIKIAPHSYHVRFNNIDRALEKLCSIPEISIVMKTRLPRFNNYMGAGYTQLNTLASTKTRFLNDINLKGTETIVGVTDSFIDTNSTFFYDTKYPGKLEHEKLYNDHRKIVIIVDSPAYKGENTTYAMGEHGTHTSGSAVGSAIEQSVSMYNGVAPDAKLAFVQANEGEGRINIEDSAFDKIIKSGAKIISNSWGGLSNDYSENLINTNSYNGLMYQYQDNLFVFAAGNSGQMVNPTKYFYQNVGYPGSCKNALTVGSLDIIHINPETPEKNVFLYLNDFTYYEFNLHSWVKDSDAYNELFANGKIPLLLTDLNPSIFSREDRDKCMFLIKSEEALKKLSSDPPKYIITSFSIKNFDLTIFARKVFIGSIDEFTTKEAEKRIATANKDKNQAIATLYPNYKSGDKPKIAAYSSKGPTTNGILKPDVVAPGEGIFSSASFPGAALNHHYTALMSGTSMACPNVAGACALVQQYFQDRKVDPSGTLIRAVIINSADPLDGVSKNPNVDSGFGQVNLGRYIPTTDKPNAKLIWKEVTIKADSHIVAEIVVNTKSEPMRITMSYMDHALSGESMIALYVDLDLVVESPSGKIFRGNHRPDESEEMFSTNERVIINTNEQETGKYKIHVFSNKFGSLEPNHKFSIVGFGSFDSTTFDFKDATSCITCNFCTQNQFQCKSNKKWDCLGHTCQRDGSVYYHEFSAMTIPVEPLGIVQVGIVLPRTKTGSFNEITYYISPNDPFGASYTLLSSFSQVTQIDGIGFALGSIYEITFDNKDHKYPLPNNKEELYGIVMIKSNSPNKTSVKISSIINNGHVHWPLPSPTPVTMWTKDFKAAFSLAIIFGACFLITLAVSCCCCSCD